MIHGEKESHTVASHTIAQYFNKEVSKCDLTTDVAYPGKGIHTHIKVLHNEFGIQSSIEEEAQIFDYFQAHKLDVLCHDLISQYRKAQLDEFLYIPFFFIQVRTLFIESSKHFPEEGFELFTLSKFQFGIFFYFLQDTFYLRVLQAQIKQISPCVKMFMTIHKKSRLVL